MIVTSFWHWAVVVKSTSRGRHFFLICKTCRDTPNYQAQSRFRSSCKRSAAMPQTMFCLLELARLHCTGTPGQAVICRRAVTCISSTFSGFPSYRVWIAQLEGRGMKARDCVHHCAGKVRWFWSLQEGLQAGLLAASVVWKFGSRSADLDPCRRPRKGQR